MQMQIDYEKVVQYRSVGMSWIEIAKLIGCCNKTLQRWRQKIQFVDPLRNIEEEELDNLVLNYANEHPERGERMLLGELRSQGVQATRANVRASVNRIDAVAKETRKRKKVRRRVYSVPGNHWLWHMDGWHKCDRYGMVIWLAQVRSLRNGNTRVCGWGV